MMGLWLILFRVLRGCTVEAPVRSKRGSDVPFLVVQYTLHSSQGVVLLVTRTKWVHASRTKPACDPTIPRSLDLASVIYTCFYNTRI